MISLLDGVIHRLLAGIDSPPHCHQLSRPFSRAIPHDDEAGISVRPMRAAADTTACMAIEPVLRQSERERALSTKMADAARLLRRFDFYRFVRTLQREPSQGR